MIAFRALVLLAVLLGAGPALARDGFLDAIPDLPLAAGLTEDQSRAVVFDKATGRIVEAVATGAVDRARVVAFYAATLPELGWRPLGDLSYARGDERLRLTIDGGDGALRVRFSLSPD